MGMSMNVIGIPERDHFDKMIELKLKCEEMGVSLPAEVKEYFGEYHYETVSCLKHETLYQDVPHRDWNDQTSQGFEIDVKEIPENIKTIRFYCSW